MLGKKISTGHSKLIHDVGEDVRLAVTLKPYFKDFKENPDEKGIKTNIHMPQATFLPNGGELSPISVPLCLLLVQKFFFHYRI